VLSPTAVNAWLSAHPGWAVEADKISRTFTFPDFSTALAFVVRVGLFAEKTDHHPEIALTWGRATVHFTTHEPPGLTQLDLDGAEHADRAHGGR